MDRKKLVLSHGDLRVNFLYQIKHDGDNDEDRCPTQSKGSIAGNKLHNERQNRDKS